MASDSERLRNYEESLRRAGLPLLGSRWILALLVVLAAAFLAVRLPREARALEGEAGEGSAPLRVPEAARVV
ncbi:MAG TPA: hypothetical protein VF052_04070 [Solirubrobacterales bacterium]